MSKQFPHPFSYLAVKYRALRKKLPVEVSNIAVKEFKDNFKKQGYEGESGIIKWRPRNSDKDKGRAILVKSGRLRRSIRPRPNFNYAIVVSNVPYARIHNEGGEIKKTMTVREHRRRQSVVSQHTRRVNYKIHARPFMITTPGLMDKIERHVFKELDKIF